jgi:predicted nucleotidyltransferase
MTHDNFPEPLNRIIDDLLPLIKQLFSGKYTIAVAGSYGKKRNDSMSDIDLRAYYENWIPDTDRLASLRQTIDLHITDWRRQGIEIDGY